MIPLKYNLRNLRVRWVTTLVTVLATALVVASSSALFGMVEGIQESMRISGDPLDLIVLRKGSSNEINGGYDTTKADLISTLDGVARGANGKPMAASELLNIPVIQRRNGSRVNVIVRGVDPVSVELRPGFKIESGRMFDLGKGECIASKPLSRRIQGAGLGETLRCGDNESYRVVGIFTANGGAAESEIWCDRHDLERNMQRTGSVSSVQLRAISADARDQLIKRMDTDPQFGLRAMKEADYFAEQSLTALFLEVVGVVIAVSLSIGAVFAAANTMFAAVKSRTREIGTLRALGFSRFDVLLSFMGESVILCGLGGLVGWLATLPLMATSFGMNDVNNFSEKAIHFRFGPLVFLVAFFMTLAMGLFGGLFPALRAVGLDVIKALREV